jgi:hypothetical protein
LWNPLPFSPWEPTQKKESKQRVSVAEREAAESKERERIHAERIAKVVALTNDDADEWTDPEYRPNWFRASKPVRALPAAKNAGKCEDDRCIVWNKMPVAPVDAEQDASDVIPLQSDEDMLILDAWPALEADPELGLSPFINWLTEDWPTLPCEARATEAPREFYLALSDGSAITTAEDLASFKATPAPADEISAPVADIEQSVSPAWREVFGDLSEQPTKKRAYKSTWHLPPDLSPEEDAAYRASFDSEPLEPSDSVERAVLAYENEGGVPSYKLKPGEYVEDSFFGPVVRMRETPAEPAEPVAELVALPEVDEPVVEPVAQPQWLKKQQARIEREAHKKAAEKQRAKDAKKRAAAHPSTHATLGAVAARATALAHIYSLKLT